MSFSRRLLRAFARGLVYPVVAYCTLLVLWLRARLVSPRRLPRRLEFTGRDRVLVVAAHPDDETIGCAAAIASHLRAGDAVDVLIVTDGRGSRAGELSPDEMARRRRGELDRVASLFRGVTFHQLGMPEQQWDERELATGLAELMAGQPHIFYAPSCVDFHPEHLKVARCVAEVLVAAGQEVEVRVYEMQVPLGVELITNVVPLGRDLSALKGQAIAAYASQGGALNLWSREARYVGAIGRAGRGAEGFWTLSPQAYIKVVSAGRWSWHDTPFKSLDGRPFGDLRAHLRGARVRRRLRSLACDTAVAETRA